MASLSPCPLPCNFVDPSNSESEFGRVTSFGQWDVSKWDANRDLQSSCEFSLALLHDTDLLARPVTQHENKPELIFSRMGVHMEYYILCSRV